MKQQGVSKKPLKRNQSLRQRIEQDLKSLYRKAALVASFFLAATVGYITG